MRTARAVLLTGVLLAACGNPEAPDAPAEPGDLVFSVTPPPGFTLVPPAPPPLPAIGSVYRPTVYLATSQLPVGGWPGPAISAFPWIDIRVQLPTLPGGPFFVSTDNVLVATPLSPRADALVMRVGLGSFPSGGGLWLVFGGNPFGAAAPLIIQGPRNGAPIIWTGTLFADFRPPPPLPKGYQFHVILTDGNDVVLAVQDPLMLVGDAPAGTPPSFPFAPWLLQVQPGETVHRRVPRAIVAGLRHLGFDPHAGGLTPSDNLICPTDPPQSGLPPRIAFNPRTGVLGGTVAHAASGTYCATFDVLGPDAAKVAELAIIVTVSQSVAH